MKSFDFPNIFKYVVGYLDLNLGNSQENEPKIRKSQKLKTNSSSSQSVEVINCKNKLGIVSRGINLCNIMDESTFKIKKTALLQQKEDRQSLRNSNSRKTKRSQLFRRTYKTIKDSIKQDIVQQNQIKQEQRQSQNKENQNLLQKRRQFSKNKITIRKIESKLQFKSTSKLDSQNSKNNNKRTSIIKRVPLRYLTQMIQTNQNRVFDTKASNKRNINKQKKTKILKFNVDSLQTESNLINFQNKKTQTSKKTIKSSKNGTKKTFKQSKSQRSKQQFQKQQIQIHSTQFQKKISKLSKNNISLKTFKRNKKQILNYTSLQFILYPEQIAQKQQIIKQRKCKSDPLIYQKDKISRILQQFKIKSQKQPVKILQKQSIPNFKKVVFKDENRENKGKNFKGVKRVRKDKNSQQNDVACQTYESQFYISSKKQLKSSIKKIANNENQYGNVFLQLNNFQKFMELQIMQEIQSQQNFKKNNLTILSQVRKKNQESEQIQLMIKKFEEDKMLQMSKKFTKKANELKQLEMRCQAHVSNY